MSLKSKLVGIMCLTILTGAAIASAATGEQIANVVKGNTYSGTFSYSYSGARGTCNGDVVIKFKPTLGANSEIEYESAAETMNPAKNCQPLVQQSTVGGWACGLQNKFRTIDHANKTVEITVCNKNKPVEIQKKRLLRFEVVSNPANNKSILVMSFEHLRGVVATYFITAPIDSTLYNSVSTKYAHDAYDAIVGGPNPIK